MIVEITLTRGIATAHAQKINSTAVVVTNVLHFHIIVMELEIVQMVLTKLAAYLLVTQKDSFHATLRLVFQLNTCVMESLIVELKIPLTKQTRIARKSAME
jgi:hypothetical protein